MQYKEFFWYLFEGVGRNWRDLELVEIAINEYKNPGTAFWLDPHGNFHSTLSDINNTYADGHWGFARNYCQQNGLLPTATGPVDELLKRKWVRIAYNYYDDKYLHFDYEGAYPSPHMLRAIAKKSDALGAVRIYDDIENQVVEL